VSGVHRPRLFAPHASFAPSAPHLISPVDRSVRRSVRREESVCARV
jgi:hypothetical protein